MLSFQTSKNISLVAKVENTPELVGFWEKQYKDIFSKGYFDLDTNTNNILEQLDNNAIDLAFVPGGIISIEKHLVGGKVDKELMQNTVDVAVRFLDSLIDSVNYTDEKSDLILGHRIISLGIGDIESYKKTLDPDIADNKIQSFCELVSGYIYRASELLAEEKGVPPLWSEFNQNVRSIDFENWIDESGEIIGNGSKISGEYDNKSITKTKYEIVPRRNVELLNLPFMSGWNEMKIVIDNYNDSQQSAAPDRVEENGEDLSMSYNIETNEIDLFFIGYDGNNILYEQGGGLRLPRVDYENGVNPAKFLKDQLLEIFNIKTFNLELVSVDYLEDQFRLAICYSGKIENKKYKNLIFKKADSDVDVDTVDSNFVEKYLSKNKILNEFRELMTKNPGAISQLKNSNKNPSQPRWKNVQPKQKEKQEYNYREFDIDTESFGRIKIKLGLVDKKIKSLEFLLNEEFKNRFAVFYSSFIFITSILNYMLSMDEDLNKVVDFLEENMKLGSSIGLVSKVVYYSLQSIKELV